MERLTEWINDGEKIFAIPRTDLRNCGHERCATQLARYEDTGLAPEEIEVLAAIQKEVDKTFNGTLEIMNIVHAFIEYYKAYGDGERIAECTLLTNEDSRRYKKMKWILVTKQLPVSMDIKTEEDLIKTMYLVCDNDGFTFIALWKDGRFVFMDDGLKEASNIIAWMPLPEPYVPESRLSDYAKQHIEKRFLEVE